MAESLKSYREIQGVVFLLSLQISSPNKFLKVFVTALQTVGDLEIEPCSFWLVVVTIQLMSVLMMHETQTRVLLSFIGFAGLAIKKLSYIYGVIVAAH